MSAVSGLRFNALGADDTSWLGRSFRYGIWSVMFFVGHAAGGAGIGALFGFAGAQPRQPMLVAAGLGVLCAIWATQEALSMPNRWPQWQRQVQRRWLGRLPWELIALLYGLQLGSAIATRIKIRSTYAALMSAMAVGSPVEGALIMAAFGVARALPALAIGPSAGSPDQALRRAAEIDSHARLVTRANAAALGIAAVVLVWISVELGLGSSQG
jgi:hypothetical protein